MQQELSALLSPDVTPAAAPAVPRLEGAFLRDIARAALAQLPARRPDLAPVADPDRWLDLTAAVLTHNSASGRFDAAVAFQEAQSGAAPTLLSYAGQILVVLLSEHERIQRLLHGDSGEWAALLDRMERSAYHWLGPVGRAAWAAAEARETAARTCADLWQWLQENAYPFDVPFDRWATRSLVNRLLEDARRERMRRQHVAASLDAPVTSEGTPLADTLGAAMVDEWLERESNREALLQALDQLDARSGQVARRWYLDGWRADEIAAELVIEINYVYVLRSRAIERLRKIVLTDVRIGLADPLNVQKGNSPSPMSPGRPVSGKGAFT